MNLDFTKTTSFSLSGSTLYSWFNLFRTMGINWLIKHTPGDSQVQPGSKYLSACSIAKRGELFCTSFYCDVNREKQVLLCCMTTSYRTMFRTQWFSQLKFQYIRSEHARMLVMFVLEFMFCWEPVIFICFPINTIHCFVK